MEQVVKGRLTLPPKRLTDPEFKYRPACATDIRETINKVRERIRAARLMPVKVTQ